jgi:hypothetical protein
MKHGKYIIFTRESREIQEGHNYPFEGILNKTRLIKREVCATSYLSLSTRARYIFNTDCTHLIG